MKTAVQYTQNKFPSLLDANVRCCFSYERTDLANAEFEAQGGREAVERREPGAEYFLLYDLRGDLAKRLDDDTEDHEPVRAHGGRCRTKDCAYTVYGIAPEHGTYHER
jgi:hypothetical protein